MRGKAGRAQRLVPRDGRGTSCARLGPTLCQGLSFHHSAAFPAAAAQEAGLSLLRILFFVPF